MKLRELMHSVSWCSSLKLQTSTQIESSVSYKQSSLLEVCQTSLKLFWKFVEIKILSKHLSSLLSKQKHSTTPSISRFDRSFPFPCILLKSTLNHEQLQPSEHDMTPRTTGPSSSSTPTADASVRPPPPPWQQPPHSMGSRCCA